MSLSLRLAMAICMGTVLSAPVWAINKCTDVDGKVMYQDAPCAVTAKANVQVKTWDSRTSDGSISVAPDLNLKGPPQAKPLLDLYRRWADAEKLALATGRIALAGPVAAMQAIQREAESLSSPPCLDPARKVLVELTRKSSAGLLEFMAKEALEGMVYTVVDRRKLIPAFESAIKKAKCE